MSVQVRRRREAASFLASFVGAQGELIVDTTNNRVQVHDGMTPGGFAAARLSDVVTNTRTSIVDVNYTALATDRLIAYTAITAARVVTLPLASTYPTGTRLLVVDESGASSASSTITLARAGADLINGAETAIIATAFGFVAIECNGVSRWTVVDQSASAAAVSVPVRQTVAGGPASSGAPSFLPATAASLTMAAQNISATTPLNVTAAQGYGSSGASNAVFQCTSNPSWTVTASATSYLYVNAQTGAAGATTLQPIYQYGGAIAMTTGQFTFDMQAMIGYVGNGTAAVPTPLVFVGEVVASATTITGTIAYAYNGTYDSGYVATLPANGTSVARSAAQGAALGVDTAIVALVIRNITAENGFSIGDVVVPYTSPASAGIVTAPFSLWNSRTAIGFPVGANNGFLITNKSNGTPVAATAANWSYRLQARRSWG